MPLLVHALLPHATAGVPSPASTMCSCQKHTRHNEQPFPGSFACCTLFSGFVAALTHVQAVTAQRRPTGWTIAACAASWMSGICCAEAGTQTHGTTATTSPAVLQRYISRIAARALCGRFLTSCWCSKIQLLHWVRRPKEPPFWDPNSDTSLPSPHCVHLSCAGGCTSGGCLLR